jgi:GH35 family endo-1,4-beta-xylanase
MLATTLLALLPIVAASPVARQDGVNAESLKVLAQRQNKYIGTAYQSFYLADERFEPILDGEFDQYTPENEMKWEVIQAERGVFNWTGADLVSSFHRTSEHADDRSWTKLKRLVLLFEVIHSSGTPSSHLGYRTLPMPKISRAS